MHDQKEYVGEDIGNGIRSIVLPRLADNASNGEVKRRKPLPYEQERAETEAARRDLIRVLTLDGSTTRQQLLDRLHERMEVIRTGLLVDEGINAAETDS